jgi:ParB/RepB/Spo0J family partition protein
MNAPETLAQPAGALVVARAPLAHFAASLTNRKHTDKAYLDELAASIRDHDVIQPITARPWPAARGKAPAGVLYEIVCGEGRWRAAEIAGLADIPFFWRDIDDKAAIELQLIENLKRKDLTAIEEAEGYRRLMQDHGHTADTIAAQIGKSRSHVYAQLKLLECGKKARAALADGKLDPSRALLIARIPTEALQEEALDTILGGKYQEPMSYRRAADHIQNHYMLRLAEAPFPRGDADLVAGAPKCADCPKRTGSQPELFADVKSADVCTDPACFAAKKDAHTARMIAEAKARGQDVITGKAAEKLKPSRYNDELKGDYVALDEHCSADGAKYKTYRELLGKKAPPPTLLEDPHEPGKLIEILPKATVQEHLEAKGIKLDARPGRKDDAQKKREQKAKQENAWRGRLFDAIRSHLTQDFDANQRTTPELQLHLKDIELRWVAESFFDHLSFDAQKRLARLWIGPTDKKQDDHALIADFKEGLPGRTAADHGRLLIEMALVDDTFANAWQLDQKPERLLEAAKAYDIDAEAIKKEVAAEFRAREKPKKPAKKASPPTSAAQAKDKSATKAAPAAEKKPAAPKKPKAKASPAPASPAEGNVPAAPARTKPAAEPSSLASTTWPFPTEARP